MRVVACPCSFKESLTAKAVASILHRVGSDLGHVVDEVPLADGGEGTLDALARPLALNIRTSVVRGMLGRHVGARWADGQSGIALVEAAECVGLALTPRSLRDPLRASTAGLGELIVAAVRRGNRRVLVGLGGTGTVDGGLDMRAVIREAALPPFELVGLVDVDVPLAGARMFMKQKLGEHQAEDVVDALDARLRALFSEDVARVPGAGAAGGLGAAIVELGGKLVSGAAFVVDAVGLEERVRGADLVITGEGRIDEQTLHGKAVSAVVELCRKYGKRCVGLCGSSALPRGTSLENLEVLAVTPEGQPLEDALARADENVAAAARALLTAQAR